MNMGQSSDPTPESGLAAGHQRTSSGLIVPSVSRRRFIVGAAAFGLGACSDSDDAATTSSSPGSSAAPQTTGSGSTTAPAQVAAPGAKFSADPFGLGIASGDPNDNSAVLWTRLISPDDEAILAEPVTVRWQVSDDETFGAIRAEGEVTTSPDHGHSVHAVPEGLDPDRWYHYRFIAGDAESPVGRTRTMAASGASPDSFRLAAVSCQAYGAGFYTAYRDVVASDPDLVIHLGDYIYEATAGPARTVESTEGVDVDGYRRLYEIYKSDPDLLAAHRAVPFSVIWDDHEVENNYQGDTPEDTTDTPNPDDFLQRRADAYQVWWEHMPVRLPAPTGPNFAIHRTLRVGDLAEIDLLDTRQFRSDQACGGEGRLADVGALCEASLEPSYTMLGDEQEDWITGRLESSSSRWHVLAQQVVMGRWVILPLADPVFNLDQWDGYPLARQRLLAAAAATDGLVTLTGDVHSSWVSDLMVDFDDPAGEVIGTEFVSPGITSGGDFLDAIIPGVLENSPNVRYAEAKHRGWVQHDLTSSNWTAQFRHMDTTVEPDGSASTASTWVIEGDQPVAEA